MGRDHNEGSGRARASKAPKGSGIDFWSFHPTAAQREALKAFEAEAGDPVAALEEEVMRGIALSISRAKTNDCFAVVARDQSASYGSGQALSVFHVELERALLGMLYVLRVMHPSWPVQLVTTGQRPLDW